VTIGATVCAWCSRLMVAGDPKLPISHGLCPACKAQYFSQEAA